MGTWEKGVVYKSCRLIVFVFWFLLFAVFRTAFNSIGSACHFNPPWDFLSGSHSHTFYYFTPTEPVITSKKEKLLFFFLFTFSVSNQQHATLATKNSLAKQLKRQSCQQSDSLWPQLVEHSQMGNHLSTEQETKLRGIHVENSSFSICLYARALI